MAILMGIRCTTFGEFSGSGVPGYEHELCSRGFTYFNDFPVKCFARVRVHVEINALAELHALHFCFFKMRSHKHVINVIDAEYGETGVGIISGKDEFLCHRAVHRA